MAHRTWSEKFAEYLHDKKLTQLETLLSLRRRGVKTTVSQISYWCRGATPRSARVRDQIERWSEGAIPADLPRGADT